MRYNGGHLPAVSISILFVQILVHVQVPVFPSRLYVLITGKRRRRMKVNDRRLVRTKCFGLSIDSIVAIIEFEYLLPETISLFDCGF